MKDINAVAGDGSTTTEQGRNLKREDHDADGEQR